MNFVSTSGVCAQGQISRRHQSIAGPLTQSTTCCFYRSTSVVQSQRCVTLSHTTADCLVVWLTERAFLLAAARP